MALQRTPSGRKLPAGVAELFSVRSSIRTVTSPSIRTHRRLGAAAVFHAAAALATLLLSRHAVAPLFSASLVLACAWLVWPVVLALHPGRSVPRVLAPVLLGGVLLAPCVSALFLILCWSANGFAP